MVDELNPERCLSKSEIASLMAPLVNDCYVIVLFTSLFQPPLPTPVEFHEEAYKYSFDPVLYNLCHRFGTLMTKVNKCTYLAVVIVKCQSYHLSMSPYLLINKRNLMTKRKN